MKKPRRWTCVAFTLRGVLRVGPSLGAFMDAGARCSPSRRSHIANFSLASDEGADKGGGFGGASIFISIFKHMLSLQNISALLTR